MNKEHTFQDILSSAKQAFTSARPGVDCPDAAMLTDYACRELPTDDIVHIKSHIQTCQTCRMQVLRLEADQYLWNDTLNHAAETALNQALGRKGRQAVKTMMQQNTEKRTAFVSKIQAALTAWTSPFWQPQYAGEAVTAADIEEQTTRFEMDYGEYINLSCHWQDGEEGQQCIDLSWQANLLQPSTLWVRFINPESGAVLTEIPLGGNLEGGMRISAADLTFNPAREKWAIAIIVEESS